jgi:hypothetical protein
MKLSQPDVLSRSGSVSIPPGGTRHWAGSGYSVYEHRAKKSPAEAGLRERACHGDGYPRLRLAWSQPSLNPITTPTRSRLSVQVSADTRPILRSMYEDPPAHWRQQSGKGAANISLHDLAVEVDFDALAILLVEHGVAGDDRHPRPGF